MRNKTIKTKDLRNFELIFFIIFLLIGLYPLLDKQEPKIFSLGISTLFLLIAFIKPELMKGFYVIWVKVSDIIGAQISRAIMFILYFVLFTPTALILRLFGKDLLNKKIDRNAPSYWIKRDSQPQTMKNQF
jgi:hypothetical protein